MSKTVRMADQKVTGEPDADSELFMTREHTTDEIADYDAGFKSGECGDEPDETKSLAWQAGWAEANE